MKHFKTISAFHAFINLPAPQHPLISVVDVATIPHRYTEEPTSMVFDFYSISVKRMSNVKSKYGQQPFDFNEGILSFMSPGQVFSMAVNNEAEVVIKSGWVIYIHPDFIWNTSLAKTIKNYDFWDYSLHESLFLSAKEETIINNIIENIQQEYNSNIDKFSKQIIISQIESLLTYADRFYHRQFITREKATHQILGQLETVPHEYFNSNHSMNSGLPTVQYIAVQLHLLPKYLSSLLRTLTGQNTQQHIHDKLIDKAKKNYLPPASPLAKLLTNWVLSIYNHSANYLKQKPAYRLWSLEHLLIEVMLSRATEVSEIESSRQEHNC